MNKRPIIYLGIALAVALAILLIERPERPRVGGVSEEYFIPGYDSAKIQRVEVEQLVDGCTLKREGDGWLVSDLTTPLRKELLDKEGREAPQERWFTADRARVGGALGAFGGLEQGVVVSDNPGKQSLYQVDKAGVSVRAFDSDGKEITDVVVGKNGPDFSSTYIRRADGDRVYLIRRSIVGMFSPRAFDWRERRIWPIEPASVSAIEVKSPKGKWSAARDEKGEWKITQPSESIPDQTRFKEFVGKLAHLTAEDFADNIDAKSAGMDAPPLSVAITYADGKTAGLSIGGKDPQGRSYARLEGADQIYLLSGEFVAKIPLEPPK